MTNASQAHRPRLPRETRPLSILVVDDEPDMVHTLAALLGHAGHVVHVCTNPAFAVDTIRRVEPDVCVLDIVMPRKTGFSIARAVWALPLRHRPALIALSGIFTTPKDEVVAKSAGFDQLVPKGSDPAELLGIISGLAEVLASPAA